MLERALRNASTSPKKPQKQNQHEFSKQTYTTLFLRFSSHTQSTTMVRISRSCFEDTQHIPRPPPTPACIPLPLHHTHVHTPRAERVFERPLKDPLNPCPFSLKHTPRPPHTQGNALGCGKNKAAGDAKAPGEWCLLGCVLSSSGFCHVSCSLKCTHHEQQHAPSLPVPSPPTRETRLLVWCGACVVCLPFAHPHVSVCASTHAIFESPSPPCRPTPPSHA